MEKPVLDRTSGLEGLEAQVIRLDAAAYEAFVRSLEEPAQENPALRRLMQGPVPWEPCSGDTP